MVKKSGEKKRENAQKGEMVFHHEKKILLWPNKRFILKQTCKQGNHYNDCKLLVGGTPPNPENMKQSFMAVVDSWCDVHR